MDLGLEGKVAVVTGAARDVGRDIALALAAEGAKIAVNYRGSEQAANEVVETIKSNGGEAIAYQGDVADYQSVQSMTDKIISDFGQIDVLVNNAGLVTPKLFLETSPDEWHQQIGVGLYGVIHCCHAMAPHMVANNGGRIISLAGDSARIGESRLSITAASRGGVLTLTKSLAREFGRSNITVNAIALGLIETAHSDKAWLDKYRDRIVKQYPLGRIGEPEDIGPMITFLASEKASWITGQVMSINGGFCMPG